MLGTILAHWRRRVSGLRLSSVRGGSKPSAAFLTTLPFHLKREQDTPSWPKGRLSRKW
jgi:hypothetical protein